MLKGNSNLLHRSYFVDFAIDRKLPVIHIIGRVSGWRIKKSNQRNDGEALDA